MNPLFLFKISRSLEERYKVIPPNSRMISSRTNSRIRTVVKSGKMWKNPEARCNSAEEDYHITFEK